MGQFFDQKFEVIFRPHYGALTVAFTTVKFPILIG